MGILQLLKTGAELEREQYHNTLAWHFDALVGHVIEMRSGSTTRALSFAGDLILSAQHRGEPCAWITTTKSFFFPPDFDYNGIDLNGLAVLNVPDAHDAAFCADRLLKSSGFGCIVLDLDASPYFPIPLQRRIAMLAKKERACILYLIAAEEENDEQSPRRYFTGTQILASSRPPKDTLNFEIELDHKKGIFRHKETKSGTPGLH